MREIFFNSDITPKAADELKLLALYYDRVNVVNDAVYAPKFTTRSGEFAFDGVDDIQFIPKSFSEDYKLLIDEGIISITNKEQFPDRDYDTALDNKISDLLNKNHNLIFPRHPSEAESRLITEEVYEVMKYMFDFEFGKPVEVNLVWWYYALKTKWFLKLLADGQSCISSSKNLNHLFNTFIRESSEAQISLGSKGYSKSLAFDALKIALPNPTALSFHDILELKFQLKDELTLFYQTINRAEQKNKELFGINASDEEYQSLFFDEIQKPLRELEIKMQNLNSRTFRKFIDKMQNPKSYIPLVGTVVATVPVEYALLTSLGMTVGQSYLEYKEDKREAANNGLYFLLKLK